MTTPPEQPTEDDDTGSEFAVGWRDFGFRMTGLTPRHVRCLVATVITAVILLVVVFALSEVTEFLKALRDW